MRTTVNLDDDVAAAVIQRRRESGMGLSETINTLVREGLAVPAPKRAYVHRSAPLGLRTDVSNIGEVLDLLDSER